MSEMKAYVIYILKWKKESLAYVTCPTPWVRGGEIFNSLCGTQESRQSPKRLHYKQSFTWNSVVLQKMVILQLHNITFSAVGLEQITIWQSLQQHSV